MSGITALLNEHESALKSNETHGTGDIKMLICVIGGIVILLVVIFFSAFRCAPPT